MVGEWKPWYQSTLVWTGVIEAIIGALELVAKYLESGDFSSVALIMLIAGIFTVFRRVWGSNIPLY